MKINSITRPLLQFGLATLTILTASVTCHAQVGVITTVAGNGTRGAGGDGGPATSAQLGGQPLGVAVDGAGNLYILDGGNNRIRKVNTAGVITTVAGGGTGVGTGDGGPATSAQVFPQGVAADSAGNLYLAAGAAIRKVDTNGILSTVAGGLIPGFSGDGGPATSAQIFPTSVAVDSAGNIYLSDTINQRIRKIDTAGIVTTFAGNGTQGFSGDGGPATSAALALPQGLAVDTAGNVYFASNTRIRKVDTAGIITTVAGNGTPIGIGEGVPAIGDGMAPSSVAVDGSGNIYFTDVPSRIRKVNTAGLVSSFAGGFLPGFAGDGGPAIRASLFNPTGVAVDTAGNVYVADTNNNRIRKVSGAAAISVGAKSLSFYHTTGGATPASQTLSIASTGDAFTFSAGASTSSGGWLSVSPGSGTSPATLTVSITPTDLAPGTYAGTIAIVAGGAVNSPQNIAVSLTVSATAPPVITTVAGSGFILFSGDGGQAINAGFLGPNGIAVDSTGNLYLAGINDSRVRKVDTAGIITTLAGNGEFAFSGDGGPATSASLFNPTAVAADSAGNVYIVDSTNNRIRKVTPAGIISTVAGNGNADFSGDGGPATSATLFSPLAVAVDNAGNLYIVDSASRIRKVDTDGVISTVAGGIFTGFSGDGGPATGASLFAPAGIAVDAAGNLYIADVGNVRIRKVGADGIISTVAGNGTKGFSGDGGSATSAQLNPFGAHQGLAVDSAGNLYIADVANHRIRKVDTAGIISTVAGNGTGAFSGDGGPAFSASLNNPTDVAVDSAGNLFIADTTNLRVRKVALGGQ